MRSPAEVEVDWRFAAADQDRAARFFSEQGFVAFSDLVGADELGRLRDAYDECVADGRIRRLDHGMVVENDVVLKHEAFAAIIDSDALVGAARALLGGVAVELQHSKITQRTLEDSGEGVLEWHQDFPFFPHTNYDLIAVLVHLDDEDDATGPIQVLPGSHLAGPRTHVGPNGEFAYRLTEPVDDLEAPVLLSGPAGQVTVHHCNTVHGSAPKTDRNQRRYVIPQYRAQDNVQLAGVVWECTGRQVMERESPRFARMVDGTRVELRGAEGRLYDRAGQLAADD